MPRPSAARSRSCILLPVMACFAWFAPALAQPRRIERITVAHKLALVIGNQSYRTSPLTNPVRDAAAMERVLSEMGFNVTLKQDLSLRGLIEAISAFTSRLQTGDLALVFYSGHGMQIDGENYLNPVDLDARDETDAKYGSYSVSQLREKLERSGARLRVIVLDACRDNPFKSTRGGRAGLAPVADGAEGTLISYATGDNSVASDNVGGANGLFTTYLIEALREPGLELDQVFKRVKASVYNASLRKQTPYTYSNIVGEFYFRPAAATALVANSAEVEYWHSIADSNDARLFQAYKSRYPQGQFLEIAETRLLGIRNYALAEGKRLKQSNDHAGTMAQFEVAAELGSAEAMVGLGDAYDAGWGGTADSDKALAWYRKAADAGSGLAMYNIGRFYALGRGVAWNLDEAMAWYRKAAASGERAAVEAAKLAGERNYVELRLTQTKQPVRLGGVGLLLKSTDPKKNRYTLDILVDDKFAEKRDKLVNEPVQFLTSASGHIPYEIVILQVNKNQVVGYMAVPKEATPGANSAATPTSARPPATTAPTNAKSARMVAAGVPGSDGAYYLSDAEGFINLTRDGGTTWYRVSPKLGAATAIAVAPSDPGTVYVGTGRGIWITKNGGKSWTLTGLYDCFEFSQIAIDPREPGRVFVAALGPPDHPTPERGIYRSSDGGQTWLLVRYLNTVARALDVTIEPSDSNSLYATFASAGDQMSGGIHHSTDGGNNWTNLRGNGLPSNGFSRARIALAPSQPNRLYAIVDDGSRISLYRSSDGGEHWLSDSVPAGAIATNRDLPAVAVDPRDAETVYLAGASVWKTTDGGKTWWGILGGASGSRVWVDPTRSGTILISGGTRAWFSLDDGITWSVLMQH